MSRLTLKVFWLLFAVWVGAQEAVALSAISEATPGLNQEQSDRQADYAAARKPPRPTRLPTAAPSPTRTRTPTRTPTMTATALPTSTPTMTVTLAPTVTPSQTASPTGTPALETAEPFDRQESNVTDSSVAFSWQTEAAVTGAILFGEEPGRLNQLVSDHRGWGQYFVHWVEIGHLDDETEYYYKIISAGFSYDDSGAPYQITTGPILSIPGIHYPYGRITSGADCSEPATEALVYCRILKNDGWPGPNCSQLLSDLVDSSEFGWWWRNLAGARTADLELYFDDYSPGENWLWLKAVHPILGTVERIVSISVEEKWLLDDLCLE